MESIFLVSSYAENCHVKFETCTFIKASLTWWNIYTKTMCIEFSYSIICKELNVMRIEEYFPRKEILKLEQDVWSLTMKETQILAYTSRHNYLAILCQSFVTPQYKNIKRYIRGLITKVEEIATAYRINTYDHDKKLAIKLTNQLVCEEIMIKKENATRVESKKWNYDGSSMETSFQISQKKQKTKRADTSSTNPQKKYMGEPKV